MLQSLFGLQLPLTHKLFNKNERYIFLKNSVRLSLLCRRYDSACICVCIVVMAILQFCCSI